MEQLNLIDSTEYVGGKWCSDDWETPDSVAQYMASLVKPTDKRILEPAAGTGQIVKHMAERVARFSRRTELLANEIKRDRFDRLRTLKKTAPVEMALAQSDFLNWSLESTLPFDCIVSNPPFSLAMQFIERSLQLLNPNNPEARLIYLLPCDFFQSQGRAKQFSELDCRIYQRHSIVGRVAYLKNGVPFDQRQIYDCVYEIRPGKVGDALPEVFVNL